MRNLAIMLIAAAILLLPVTLYAVRSKTVVQTIYYLPQVDMIDAPKVRCSTQV